MTHSARCRFRTIRRKYVLIWAYMNVFRAVVCVQTSRATSFYRPRTNIRNCSYGSNKNDISTSYDVLSRRLLNYSYPIDKLLKLILFNCSLIFLICKLRCRMDLNIFMMMRVFQIKGRVNVSLWDVNNLFLCRLFGWFVEIKLQINKQTTIKKI